MFSATSVAASGPAKAPARVDAVGDLLISFIILDILRALFTEDAVLITVLPANPAIGIRSIAPRTASPRALSSLPSLTAEVSRSCKAKGLSSTKKPCSRYSSILVSRNISKSCTDMFEEIAWANSWLIPVGFPVTASNAPIGKFLSM